MKQRDLYWCALIRDGAMYVITIGTAMQGQSVHS